MKYTRGDTIVGFEKLWFLQRRHAARYAQLPKSENPLHDLTELAVKPIVKLLDDKVITEDLPLYAAIPNGFAREKYISSIVVADAQNYTTPDDFVTRSKYFFQAPSDEVLGEKIPRLRLESVPLKTSRLEDSDISFMFHNIKKISSKEWSRTMLKVGLDNVIEKGIKSTLDMVEGAANAHGIVEATEVTEAINTKRIISIRRDWSRLIHSYLRWAITAGDSGPNGVDTMAILGKEETERRLNVAETVIKNNRDKAPLGGI
jgi:glutamyl-tRNA synthetase